ncbi:MAG: hypothetical protein E7384_00910 [Ruminococcaceae bacterium]|nr:hypothetical protein [Oscillospiraceae bacterium]
MTENMRIITENLIASYNKYITEFWVQEMDLSKNANERKSLDIIASGWGDAECELLGKTPKDYIGESLPEEIDFDDIIGMFNSFAVGATFDIPDAVCDLFFSAPEAAEEYLISVIDDMDLSINGDDKISDEENKKLCIFIEAVSNLHRITKEKAKDALFGVYGKCSENNPSILEVACNSMIKCGFVSDMISLFETIDKIGVKEHFILQELVHIQGDEDVFKCLKSCLKKDCDDMSMTVQIVSDCGDGRLIPLIRKIARNELKALYAAGKTPYDESEEANKFFIICNAVTRLGGSIEDLLTFD